MNGILIADAGSTKTDWALLSDSNHEVWQYSGKGLNPVQMSEKDIYDTLLDVRKSLPPNINIKFIRYFGAGCATHDINEKLKHIIGSIWPETEITVSSDLQGAAISLFGNNNGIACILGTGSNSCQYIAGEISQHIPPLGYILGDEGSATALGRRLLTDIFKRTLSNELIDEFQFEYHLSLQDLLNNVYKAPRAAQFLSSFSPFISKNIKNPEIYRLAYEEFELFFRRNVCKYTECHNLSVGFIGSVAVAFENIIRTVCIDLKLHPGIFIKAPVDGLVNYFKR